MPTTSHRRFRTLTAALGLVLVLSTAACGGSGESGGKTTITFANWAYAEDATQAGIKDLVEKFEKDNPDVKVKMEAISFTDIAHKVLLEARSGNAPDVTQIAGNDLFSLSEANLLEPLDEHMSDEYRKSIIPAELKLGQIGGEQVAAPWTVTPFGFWYNKKLMKQAGLDPNKPPATMDDLLDAMKTVKQKLPGVTPIGMDATNRSFGLDSCWSFMKTFGGEPFTDKKATASSDGMEQYLEFMRTVGQNKYTQLNKKIGDFRPIAAENKLAFMWDGPYLQTVVEQTAKMSSEEFYKTWGVTTLPEGPAGEAYSAPTDHQLAVLKSSENKEAAWKFVEYLSTSQEGMKYIMTTGSSVPAVAEPGGAAAKLSDTPVFDAFRDDLVPTVSRPAWGPGYGKAYSPVMAGVQSAMTTDKPIADITGSMQKQVESALR
ncbi:MAG: extracellular solute-binding protein [Streptosporangiales bacterium]|nr:extracellular solute-binding protein [Streptosporangiales bacterium]